MKIVPWIIIVFMIYLIYYFISRSEKRLNALEKRLNNIEENLSELKKATEANRLLIEEEKLNSKKKRKSAARNLKFSRAANIRAAATARRIFAAKVKSKIYAIF